MAQRDGLEGWLQPLPQPSMRVLVDERDKHDESEHRCGDDDASAVHGALLPVAIQRV